MPQQPRVLVTGAGGFIGHHLTNYLVDRGYWVRGVDIKIPEFESTRADEFLLLDLTVAGNYLFCARSWIGSRRSRWRKDWIAPITGSPHKSRSQATKKYKKHKCHAESFVPLCLFVARTF